jgi:hypothetical protein
MQSLVVGQEVWGFISPLVTVKDFHDLDVEYQEHGSVVRLSDEFRASIGGGKEGLEYEDYFQSQEQAYAAARLPIEGEVLAYSADKPVVRIKTDYDR